MSNQELTKALNQTKGIVLKHIAELEAENEALREFICHHGGLINEWASEYIEHKLDFWLEEK